MEVEDLDRLELPLMVTLVPHWLVINYIPDELRFPEIKDVLWTYSSADQSELMTSAQSATPGLIAALTDCERANGMD
ncbi:hypothetical protein NC653_008047 [Populus alba x Populus x berolinensis]|uniref:Uncharacterized protein n=1 Tax=Populus alba x Populus x berolinensis TaxID=444605 RepID=A0AAD6R5F4_9ROSI|nr:hypothetical protein NC653_008047 [Populus alba x Populus x berolinensis]